MTEAECCHVAGVQGGEGGWGGRVAAGAAPRPRTPGGLLARAAALQRGQLRDPGPQDPRHPAPRQPADREVGLLRVGAFSVIVKSSRTIV